MAFLKNAFPFKTLESPAAPRRRIAPGAVLGLGEFFASLREVSVRALLDLAGVGSGLIEKRSRSRVVRREHPAPRIFRRFSRARGVGGELILPLAVDREGKDL